MKKLKAFIVEDENHNRDYLQSLLADHFDNQIEICGASGSIIESIEVLKTLHIDILFLDIELADGQVFELLKQIDHQRYRLIFITGYSEHAIKAIRFSAVDYILKPIVTRELIDAVNKVIKGTKQNNKVLDDLIDRKQFELTDYLVINSQHAIEKIVIEKITHLEADGVYTIIHHEQKKTISSKPIGVYEDVLSSKIFNRCHKSYMVSRHHIKRVAKGRGPEITLFDGTVIPVAMRKKEEFGQWLKD